jgi:hypothetical protein
VAAEFRFLPEDVEALFAELVRPRLLPGEDIQDVLAGSYILAQQRARYLGREPLALDVEFALAWYCWWPFAPEKSEQILHDLQATRQELFTGIATGRSPEMLFTAISGEALTWSLDQLYDVQRSGGPGGRGVIA